MQKGKSLIPFFTALLFLMLSGTAHAQLGEFASHLVFNVTLGQSETLPWTIFNSGQYPITYNVIAPSIIINNVSGLSSKNRTDPIITVSPSNGVLQPRQNQVLNITVYMPAKNNTGGLSWEAIPQAVELTNNSNPGGAVIQVGVAKIIAINAVNPPAPDYALYAGIIIAVMAIGGGAYYIMKSRKPSRAAGARRAAVMAARKPAVSRVAKPAGGVRAAAGQASRRTVTPKRAKRIRSKRSKAKKRASKPSGRRAASRNAAARRRKGR